MSVFGFFKHIIFVWIGVVIYTVITLENLRTRKVQSLRGGCSRRVHKIVYLAV